MDMKMTNRNKGFDFDIVKAFAVVLVKKIRKSKVKPLQVAIITLSYIFIAWVLVSVVCINNLSYNEVPDWNFVKIMGNLLGY